MRGHTLGAALALSGCLLLLGCGSPDLESPEVTGTTPADDGTGPLRLSVIGDSIPFNAPEDCPDCDGFVSQFMVEVTEATGRPVTVDNFARHDEAGIDDLVIQLDSQPQMSLAIADSDLVLVSIGAFDMPPWPAEVPCGSAATTPAETVAQVLAYTPECIDAAVATFDEGLETIYGTIAELRADQPSALIALTVYDVSLDDPRLPPLDDAQRQLYIDNMVLVHDRWNESLCELATADGFECVDVYAAFNGPDGRTPVGANVAEDHFHPSQAGNDVIAELLGQIDLSALG